MGAQFEAYAAQRVRGAMLDGLRENDWLPRSLRRNCRRIEAAIAQLEQEKWSCADRKELADALGMTLADYQKMLQDARASAGVLSGGHGCRGGEDFLERHLVDEARDPANDPRGRESSSARWCRRSNCCRSVKTDDGALL
jgi:RNA polymerase sigma factor for flagellar operon FliA